MDEMDHVALRQADSTAAFGDTRSLPLQAAVLDMVVVALLCLLERGVHGGEETVGPSLVIVRCLPW